MFDVSSEETRQYLRSRQPRYRSANVQKCSGSKPACENCSKRGDRCIYDHARPATRVEKLKKQLEERDEAERRLQGSRPERSSSGSAPTSVTPEQVATTETDALSELAVAAPQEQLQPIELGVAQVQGIWPHESGLLRSVPQTALSHPSPLDLASVPMATTRSQPFFPSTDYEWFQFQPTSLPVSLTETASFPHPNFQPDLRSGYPLVPAAEFRRPDQSGLSSQLTRVSPLLPFHYQAPPQPLFSQWTQQPWREIISAHLPSFPPHLATNTHTGFGNESRPSTSRTSLAAMTPNIPNEHPTPFLPSLYTNHVSNSPLPALPGIIESDIHRTAMPECNGGSGQADFDYNIRSRRLIGPGLCNNLLIDNACLNNSSAGPWLERSSDEPTPEQRETDDLEGDETYLSSNLCHFVVQDKDGDAD